MKIFRYLRKDGVGNSLAMDPAARAAGFSLLNAREKTIETFRYNNDQGVVNLPFPLFFQRIERVVDDCISLFMQKTDLSDTEIVLEYTFMGGSFSVGLTSLTALLVQRLWNDMKVPRIVFVPTRVGSFYLKKRKTTKGEHVKLVREQITALRNKRINQHEADAVLIQTIANYEFFRKHFGFDPRQPVIDLIDVIDLREA